MGRIKQTYLKRVAEKLMTEYPDVFVNAEFNDVKKKVSEHTDITSKSIRNKIAGYITRVIKQRNKKAD